MRLKFVRQQEKEISKKLSKNIHMKIKSESELKKEIERLEKYKEIQKKIEELAKRKEEIIAEKKRKIKENEEQTKKIKEDERIKKNILRVRHIERIERGKMALEKENIRILQETQKEKLEKERRLDIIKKEKIKTESLIKDYKSNLKHIEQKRKEKEHLEELRNFAKKIESNKCNIK